MKTVFLTIIFALSSLGTMAQVVVSDPGATAVNKAGWAKSLAEAAKQCKELQETKKIMTESIEIYTKVSSAIQNAKAVKSIFDRQVKMISDIAKELKRTDIGNNQMFSTYCRRLNEIITENAGYIELLKTTLSSYEKISQGDRLKIILDLDDKTKTTLNRFQSERRRYNEYNKNYKILSRLAEIK